MNWTPILYGCFARRTGGYGFDTSVSPGDGEIKRFITKQVSSIPAGSWVTGEAAGRVFFGHCGRVGDFLEWDHPGARDRTGRILEFLMGYTAPAGTPLPSSADLESLRKQIGIDLKRLGDASWAAQGQVRDFPNVPLPAFTPPNSPSAWDETVTALNSKKSAPFVVKEPSGERRVAHSAPAPHSVAKPPKAPSPLGTANRAAEEMLEKKTLPTSRLTFLHVTVVSLLAVAIGYAGWRMLNHRSGASGNDRHEQSSNLR
jgi:hypothetical protein